MKIKLLTIIIGIIMLNEISFGQDTDFPYKLSYAVDVPLLTASLSSRLMSNNLDKKSIINYLTNEDLIQLSPDDVNKFDRFSTKNWIPKLDRASDITREIADWAPVLILFPKAKNKNWKDISTLSVMYLEGFILNEGLTRLAKISTERKRPFMYNNSTIPTEERENLAQLENNLAYHSFYSGHTSSAFFSAVFLSKVYTDNYGKTKWSYVIWGISLSLATTTGYLRCKSGWHYPSDVIVGAISGSAIGYLIPTLHKKRDKTNFSFLVTNNYLSLKYKF